MLRYPVPDRPASAPVKSRGLLSGIFRWLRRKKHDAATEAHAKHPTSALRRRKNREHLKAVRAERARAHHEGHGKAR